jgi:hypothetical protein
MLTVPLALQMGDGGALKIKFRAQCPACQWVGTSALAVQPGSAPLSALAALPWGGRWPAVAVRARLRGAAASGHLSPSERCGGRGWQPEDAGCSLEAACERAPARARLPVDPGGAAAPTCKHRVLKRRRRRPRVGAEPPSPMGTGNGGASPSPVNRAHYRGRGRGSAPDSGQIGDGDAGGASPPPGKSGRPRPRANRGRGRGRGPGCPRPGAAESGLATVADSDSARRASVFAHARALRRAPATEAASDRDSEGQA